MATIKVKPKNYGGHHKYDRYKLPFLTYKEDGRIFNGEFDVTNTSEKLAGVRKPGDPVRLIDYLVYRPLPRAVTAWQRPPAGVHPKSMDMINFYQEALYNCDNGMMVNGEYYNPLFVFWMNIFALKIFLRDPKTNELTGEEESTNPLYSNIDRYVIDLLWKAMIESKFAALMGSRGIGKSYIFTMVLMWFFYRWRSSQTVVSASSEDNTNEAWKKIDECISALETQHKELSLLKINDSGEKKFAGREVMDEYGKHIEGFQSMIEKIIYGSNPGATKGRRPHAQLIEEFANFPSAPAKGSLSNCVGQSMGSWKVMGTIVKCFTMFSGTGGSVSTDDAERLFFNPAGTNILGIEEWGRSSGIFIPVFLKMAGYWETTGCPDVAGALKEELRIRKALESSPTEYILHCREYPINIEEVFQRSGINDFNQEKLSLQLTDLKLGKYTIKAERGDLHWIYENEVDSNPVRVGVQFIKNPKGNFVQIEPPMIDDYGKVYKDLYVAGVDSIDQGLDDSIEDNGSKLAMAIKKRTLDKTYFAGNTTNNIYVGFYLNRSADVRDDYENVLMASIYYNCKVNIEYTKINIKSYFREQKQEKRLAKRPTIAMNTATTSDKKRSHLIGTQATTPIIHHMDAKLKEYIDDYYFNILVEEVLVQLIDYRPDNRRKFDYVVAMGLAELLDEDLLGTLPTSVGATKEKKIKMFGFYRDSTGKKRYGVIDDQKNLLDRNLQALLEEEQLRRDTGEDVGIRYTDPNVLTIKTKN
jgi:hypothetical protein